MGGFLPQAAREEPGTHAASVLKIPRCRPTGSWRERGRLGQRVLRTGGLWLKHEMMAIYISRSYGAVGAVDDTIGDAAQKQTYEPPEAAASEHDHPRTYLLGEPEYRVHRPALDGVLFQTRMRRVSAPRPPARPGPRARPPGTLTLYSGGREVQVCRTGSVDAQLDPALTDQLRGGSGRERGVLGAVRGRQNFLREATGHLRS